MTPNGMIGKQIWRAAEALNVNLTMIPIEWLGREKRSRSSATGVAQSPASPQRDSRPYTRWETGVNENPANDLEYFRCRSRPKNLTPWNGVRQVSEPSESKHRDDIAGARRACRGSL